MQLEHCPFCGTSHSLYPETSGRFQQIACMSCGARGPEVYRSLPYATAVESWNVRQGPAEVNATHRSDGVMPSHPPKRYDLTHTNLGGDMREAADGEYVRWDAVEHLFASGVMASPAPQQAAQCAFCEREVIAGSECRTNATAAMCEFRTSGVAVGDHQTFCDKPPTT